MELTAAQSCVPFVVFMDGQGPLPGSEKQRIRSMLAKRQHQRRKAFEQKLPQPLDLPINLRFGSRIDAFHVLPRLRLEDQDPLTLEKVQHHLFAFFSQERMKTQIYPDGLNNAGFYAGNLLAASMHFDATHLGDISDLSSAIRTQIITMVRQRLRKSAQTPLGTEALWAIGGLTSLALAQGNIDEYKIHRDAHQAILQEYGGFNTFLQGSTLARRFINFLVMNRVARLCDVPVAGLSPPTESSVDVYKLMLETRPPYQRFPDHTLASPFYTVDPIDTVYSFQTVEDDETRKLSWRLQQCFLPLQEPNQKSSRPELKIALKRDLEALVGSQERTFDREHSPRMWRACTLTARTMLALLSSEKIEDWRSQVQEMSNVAQVREHLQKTDLAGLWGPNIGILYWIVLVMYCASFQSVDQVFYHATLYRMWYQMAFELNDWRGAIQPMLVLRDFTRCSAIS